MDAKGEARIRLKNMKQGKRSVMEYWNGFRLVASEAELDDSTGGELLLGGMITELQNAWGASSEEYEDLEVLAEWAIRKETKLATDRHIQGSPSAKNIQLETGTPRNPDGTYRRTNEGNQNYGEPIELDATQRRPRFNISREEFQRRIREPLCLKCAQPGHLAMSCPKKGRIQTIPRRSQELAACKESSPLANQT